MRGHSVHRVPVKKSHSRTSWVAQSLAMFERVVTHKLCDTVLAFHAPWPFTADLRRILDDTRPTISLATYTHGSHWDETDQVRHENYPLLRWADLGNLLAADRVLVVSDWMRNTMLSRVAEASEVASRELAERICVVGLPIDLDRIDAAFRPPLSVPTVGFNHAAIDAKRPAELFDIADEMLAQTPVTLLVIRRFGTESPGAKQLAQLKASFPDRVVLGNDMAVDSYYASLWESSIQVSTATHESLGVATLEAMATANICILPRRGAYSEVSNNDAEVIYETAAELRNRLLAAIAEAGRCRAVALRLSGQIRARYAPSIVARRVSNVLIDALARSRVPKARQRSTDSILTSKGHS